MVRVLLLGIALLAGCEEPCADGSMLDEPGGLRLTEARHPTGWGQAACDRCHALPQIHRQDCTPEVDLAEVRARVAADPTGCGSCHGDNGVSR